MPAHAEKQVLQAIGSISSLVTVQSDIGGAAADIEQVDADPRLHVHLLPYQHGLKMQLLVRPLATGAYYPPGSGADTLIADVAGKPVQARRDLNAEREAERQLVGKCQILESAEQEHGEWLLGQPVLCLQLLVELQELDPATIVLAWPEGESFRVTPRVESKQLRLNIRSEKDWFAASGELQIDEDKVLDLRTLLDLMQNSQGRFVELGEQPLSGADRGTAPAPVGAGGLRRARCQGRAHPSAGRVRAGRPGRRCRRPEGGQAVERASGTNGVEGGFRATAAEHFAGRVARLSARWFRVAGAAGALGRGRLPGRRYGPRQNAAGAGADAVARAAGADAGDRADVGVHELDQRGGALRADAEREAVRRGRPQRDLVHAGAVRSGGVQLRPAATGGQAVLGGEVEHHRAR